MNTKNKIRFLGALVIFLIVSSACPVSMYFQAKDFSEYASNLKAARSLAVLESK